MANYWFFVLGLDFDVVPNVDEVNAAIKKKSNYWNDDLQQIGRYAQYYTSLAEQVPQMRKELACEADIQFHAKLAADAAYPVIDQLLNSSSAAIGGQKAIEPDKIPSLCNLAKNEIARRCALPTVGVDFSRELVTRRAEYLGITVKSIGWGNEAVSAYRKYAEGEPEGARSFRMAESELIPLGKRSLYEFACPDGVHNPKDLSSSALIAQAHSTLHELRMSPALRSAAEKLIPYMNDIIGDSTRRQQYDRYLQWRDVNETLDSAGQIAELSGGVLGGWNAADAHKRLTAALGDAHEAELVLAGYCSARQPSLVFGGIREQSASNKTDSMISLDVSSLGLSIGETKYITISASGQPAFNITDKSIINARLERTGGDWKLAVTAMAEGRAAIDIKVLEDETQRGCSAPAVDVVVSQAVRKDVRIAADKRFVELTVGQTAYVHFTSDGSEAFSASYGDLLTNCVSWHEDGSNTLVIRPTRPGTEKIGIRTKQDSEYNESNWLEIAVTVHAGERKHPSLRFSSPNITMQNGVQRVTIPKGETIALQVITDTDGAINAKWDNSDIFSAKWSNQPIENTLMLTGLSEGWTTLAFEAQKTQNYYALDPSGARIQVAVQGATPIPGPEPGLAPTKEGNLWQRSGCLGKGLIIYLIYVVVALIGYGIVTIFGMVAGN